MIVCANTQIGYTNAAGQSMGFAFPGEFVCTKCEETVTNRVHSAKQAGVHGEVVTGASCDPRYIRISGVVRHEADTAQAARTLHSVFNSTIPGTLTYTNRAQGIRKRIACLAEEVPKVYWSRGALRFDIGLVANDPFWQGPDVVEVIAQTLKNLHFALVIPKTGITFGMRHHALESVFENMGNVESGFVAVLRARFGTVTNPEVVNTTTNERIRIIYRMRPADEIVITNHLQIKRVTINGANGFRYVDAPVTRFFMLAVGTNKIGFGADENVSNLQVHITYTPGYTFA